VLAALDVCASALLTVAVCFLLFAVVEVEDDKAEHPAIGNDAATSAATTYVIRFLFIIAITLI
jgi:hypothetical protein